MRDLPIHCYTKKCSIHQKHVVAGLGKTVKTVGSRPELLSFTTETPQERMSKGAEYTNAIRAEKAIQTLQKAAVALRSSGTLVTPLTLQSASGLKINTVRM